MENQQEYQIDKAREAITARFSAGESSVALAAEMQITKNQLDRWLINFRRGGCVPDDGQMKAVTEMILIWHEGQGANHYGEMPDFVATPSAQKLLALYEETRGYPPFTAPTIALVVGASGVGKSTTAQAYRAQRAGLERRAVSGVWYVEMPKSATTNSHMLKVLYAAVLGEAPIGGFTSALDLQNQIAGKFREGDLLIVDEAQHLGFEMLDCLRWFNREHGIGIILQGNPEYGRKLGKAKRAGEHPQILSRIANTLPLLEPTLEDMDALLKAWGVKDAAIKRHCHAMYLTDGGLREMVCVLRKVCARKPDRADWTVQDLMAADGSQALAALA